MSVTEKRLGEILDSKFEDQHKLFKATMKPHEDARVQVWKNKDDITAIKTESRTNKWWMAFAYSFINVVVALVTAICTVKIFGGGK